MSELESSLSKVDANIYIKEARAVMREYFKNNYGADGWRLAWVESQNQSEQEQDVL